MKQILKKSPVLQAGDLTLGPIRACDRESMLDILCDSKVNRTYMLPDFAAREQAEPLFQRLMDFSCSTCETHFVYGIFRDDQLVGMINHCGVEGDTMELGYVIYPDHWNKGYATEALAAALRELFRMGYTRVKAGHFVENPASGRVMEKCGMRKLEETSDITYRGVVHRCINYEAVPADVG